MLDELGVDATSCSTSRCELEEVALNDDYFIERKLYPNVDFYSGLIYRAMGFPTDMFTVLFAIGRLPGWIAHWKEGNENPKTKIGRPAPDLHRADRAQVRPDRPAQVTGTRFRRPDLRRRGGS